MAAESKLSEKPLAAVGSRAGRRGAKDVEAQLEALDQLSYAELKAEWIRWFRKEPPPRLSRGLLTLSVAWKIQEKAYGGLSAATKRLLRQLAKGNDGGESSRRPAAATLRPGMQLVREWHGTVHTVRVTDSGFESREKDWHSLTAIAREITGQRWSGPRFFGLTKAPRAAIKRLAQAGAKETDG